MQDKPTLDFVQRPKRETRKPPSTVDFTQRKSGFSDEIAEKASPEWTKSNEGGRTSLKAGFRLDKIQSGGPRS